MAASRSSASTAIGWRSVAPDSPSTPRVGAPAADGRARGASRGPPRRRRPVRPGECPGTRAHPAGHRLSGRVAGRGGARESAPRLCRLAQARPASGAGARRRDPHFQRATGASRQAGRTRLRSGRSQGCEKAGRRARPRCAVGNSRAASALYRHGPRNAWVKPARPSLSPGPTARWSAKA
jgi:hypothetical protein